MKANQKIKKLQDDSHGFMQIIGALVGLLLAIIIGMMVYYSVGDSVPAMSERLEYFTGYSHGDNASAWNVILDNSPVNTANTNVTCYSSSDGTLSYPTFSLNHRTVNVGTGQASNFTQVNVTYTSNIASTSDTTNDMASTVFGILPVIALVVVASVILGIVLGFGGGGKREI
jgi:hypothetical protein